MAHQMVCTGICLAYLSYSIYLQTPTLFMKYCQYLTLFYFVSFPLRYAPESFNYGTFSHASDVWSFGVTLWEMFSFGEAPYGDLKGTEVIALVEKGTRLLQPEKCPDNVFEIMSACWNYRPKDRPTFRYLTEFFSNDPDYQNLIELIKTQNIY